MAVQFRPFPSGVQSHLTFLPGGGLEDETVGRVSVL